MDLGELDRLAQEQAALRAVATALARGAPPDELFATVAEQVGRVLQVPLVSIVRYEGEHTATECASFSEAGAVFPVGARWSLDGTNVVRMVLDTGRAARIDDYTGLEGVIAETVRRQGIRSTVGIPIVVAGRLWGAMVASSAAPEPLAEETEERLSDFTDLVASAIANTEAQEEVARLAAEQAALRRVATLVAERAAAPELFEAVTREVQGLLGSGAATMGRYEPDDTVTVVAASEDFIEVGSRWPLDGGSTSATVKQTGRPARIANWADEQGAIADLAAGKGLLSSVAAPILVDGLLWGVLNISSKEPDPLPGDSESRLVNFCELVATALSNAQARAEVERLAEEQAALRRVATLVVRGVPAAEVFAAVAGELERLFDAQATTIARLEPDGTVIIVGSGGSAADEMAVGRRLKLESGIVLAEVMRTGRSARVEDYSDTSELLRRLTQSLGIRCSVAVPIIVEGSLWGALGATTQREPFPADVEQRMAGFTELVGTAISNIQARSDLAASRARIGAAADQERRRVVRDLHDGAQQRLVQTIMTLKEVHQALQPSDEPASELVSNAIEQAESANSELRELAHGLLPAILRHGGLRAGVEVLASRASVPVDVDVSVDRLPALVEATAYFVVAEALTNVVKHARATGATALARVEDGCLQIRVRDDGVGGARPDGSGLVGLADRLAVLDSQLRVESRADGGTLIAADIPLRD